MTKPTVFLSYSHRDEVWKDRVATHLRASGFEVWDDRRIEPGDNWRPVLFAALERAQVVVLLISPDFLDSRFILEKEVPVVLQRRQEARLQVIPVVVRPCAWQTVDWLESLGLFPPDGRALSLGGEAQIDQDLAALA